MFVLLFAYPVRVALDVVERAAELVRAALGHGVDLQAARPAVLRLVAERVDLDFGDRLDADARGRPVDARIHRRGAVEHEVAVAAAADP